MNLYWPDFWLPPINLWTVWNMQPSQTGCVMKCRLDNATQRCTGCGRHIDEIKKAGKVKRFDKENADAQPT